MSVDYFKCSSCEEIFVEDAEESIMARYYCKDGDNIEIVKGGTTWKTYNEYEICHECMEKYITKDMIEEDKYGCPFVKQDFFKVKNGKVIFNT